MARQYKKHSALFKSKIAIEGIKEQKILSQLSQEYSVATTQISTWKNQLEERAKAVFETKEEVDHKEEIDKLFRIIGQVTAERDFLERALNR